MSTKTDNELNLRLRELGKKLGRVPTPAEREAVKVELGLKDTSGNNGAISQSELFAMKLKPISFLVEGLLVTPGLCLLGGKKKSNKSWLALDLSQRIASGTPFLGRKVRKGGVLYYALEDSVGRLKDRLIKLKTDSSLPVYYHTSISPLNSEGGMVELERAIKDQRPALTIIDTLSSATDKNLDENKASDTGDQMNHLRRLAIETDSCVLVILHHGKRTVFDAGFDYRGSSAIPSASDVNISLYKNEGGHTLLVEGRDLPDTMLKLHFDIETWCFQLSDNRSERRTEIEDTIIEIIGELGEAEATTVGGQLGITRIAARDYLNRMVQNKQLVSKQVKAGKTFKILYSLPESEVTPLTPLQRKDTVISETEVIKVNDVTTVSEVTNVSNKERCNEVTTVTPISEVKEPVVVVKSLGQLKGEGYSCVKGEGNCSLQSKFTKQPFACAYSPGNACRYWSEKQ